MRVFNTDTEKYHHINLIEPDHGLICPMDNIYYNVIYSRWEAESTVIDNWEKIEYYPNIHKGKTCPKCKEEMIAHSKLSKCQKHFTRWHDCDCGTVILSTSKKENN